MLGSLPLPEAIMPPEAEDLAYQSKFIRGSEICQAKGGFGLSERFQLEINHLTDGNILDLKEASLTGNLPLPRP